MLLWTKIPGRVTLLQFTVLQNSEFRASKQRHRSRKLFDSNEGSRSRNVAAGLIRLNKINIIKLKNVEVEILSVLNTETNSSLNCLILILS